MQPIQFFAARAEDGVLLPGATVHVLMAGTQTLAPIFSNASATAFRANPFSAEENARVFFYTTAPRIDIQISYGGYRAPLLQDIGTTDPADVVNAEIARLNREMVDGKVHADVAAGLFATVDGQYFYAESADPAVSRTLWQRVNAGSARHVADDPEAAYVLGIVPSLGVTLFELYDWIDSAVDVVKDQAGNLRVLLSQAPGKDPIFYGAVANVAESAYPPISAAALLNAGILSVSDFASSLYPDYVELMADENGDLRVLQVVGAGKDMTNYALTSFPPPEFVTPTGYYVWLIPNQSNEDGRGNSAESPALPEGMGYMWKGGALLPLADPVNTTTNTGSAWPAFAQRFHELTGFGSVFVPAAVGGTPQTAGAALTAIGATSHWDVGGTLRGTALSRLQAAFAALDNAGVMWQMGGVLGGGGERDAQNIDNPAGSTGSITAADYKTAAQGMLSYFRTNLSRAKLPFIMRRLAMDATGDTTGFQQIRAAQMDLCANVDGFYMSWTGGLAAIKAGRVKADTVNLHFLQQDLNDMGTCMASVAASVCLGRA